MVGKEDGENLEARQLILSGRESPFLIVRRSLTKRLSPAAGLRLLTGEAHAAATTAREREALASKKDKYNQTKLKSNQIQNTNTVKTKI
jgi:hypothetical protein